MPGQGDRRPVEGHPRAMEELREILERRTSQYARCDGELDTSGRAVEESIRTALEWWWSDAAEPAGSGSPSSA